MYLKMVKKAVRLVAVGCMVLGMGSAALAGQQVNVFVNHAALESDQPAYFEEESGITFVPVRPVSEGLGGSVTWDGSTQTIIVKRKGDTIQLKIDSNKVTVNGKEALLSAPVRLKADTGRSLVPLNFFNDVLKCQVKVSATAGVGISDEEHADPVF